MPTYACLLDVGRSNMGHVFIESYIIIGLTKADMDHEFTCINRGTYIISFGVINVVLDVVLTILPIAMIHKVSWLTFL